MTQQSDLLAKNSPVVLIANDQEWTARAVESILVANGYRTHRAHTAAETLALADRLDPDIVILDQQLPDFSGTEVCRRLRDLPAFGASLPVFITTAGPSGRQQRLAAYEAGAWEFYGQPLDAEALLHKLNVYAASYTEVRRLRREALLDEATGLYTRTGLLRRATEMLGAARRGGRDISCVAWSLAKASSGDPVVGQIGKALLRHGRSADAFGRLGATQFAVVAPGATTEGAMQLVNRFRAFIDEILVGTGVGVQTATVTVRHGDLPDDGRALLEQLSPAMAA